MKLAVVPTVAPTSIMEQAKLLAERIGGEFATNINTSVLYDAVVYIGPPNPLFDTLIKMTRTKKRICYWVVEGILTSNGRRRARSAPCDLNIAVSKAVKTWMEESDVYIDYIIPHEIIPPVISAVPNGKAVYVAGNYGRKWPPWALMTLKLTDKIEAYYKPEVPDAVSEPFNRYLEAFGVIKIDRIDKEKHYEFLAKYGVYANLSASEGFGLYIREALAMKMNVVAVAHDAFWDVVNHPCFYSVPYRDIMYIVTQREEVYEEFRSWEPTAYVEALNKALENRCTTGLEFRRHYDIMKMLIYQLLK